jgi:hypothetical protein
MASIGFDIFARDRASATLDKVGNSTEKMGHKFSAMKVAAVAGMVGAGVAIAAFGKSAISNASDVNEAASKVGVVFGKQADQILAASKTSASAMGLSKGAYLDAAGTLGNLLVSLKIAPKHAADMSQQMVKLAGDMASFNNVSPEDALLAIKSGLTGETEPLKSFGVNMNDATLHAQALKMGLIKTTKDALDPQTKALAAQALIMDQTKTAQGDFARTSNGLANQQRILKAKLADVSAEFGAKLLPIAVKVAMFATGTLIPGIASIGSAIGAKVMPYIKLFGVGLSALIAAFKEGDVTSKGFVGVMERLGVKVRALADWVRGSLIPALMTMGNWIKDNVIPVLVSAGQWMQKHADIVKYAAVTIGILVVAFKTWAIITKTVAAAQAALNLVMSMNPIGLVIIAIAALTAGLIYAYKHSETFRNIVDRAFKVIATSASAMWDVIRPVLHMWIDTFLLVVSTLVHGAANAFGWVPGLGGKLKSAARAIDAFRDDANRALDGIRDKVINVRVDVNSKGIPLSAVDRVLGANAAGTNNWRGGLTSINERGGEIINLPSGTQIIPHDVSMAAAQASGGSMDERTLTRALRSALEGASLRIYGDDGSSRRADLMTRAG